MAELRYLGMNSLAMFWTGVKQVSGPVGNASDLNAYMLRDINLSPTQRAAAEHRDRDMFWTRHKYRLTK